MNFDGRKCNLNQKWNNDKCWRECENPIEHCACKEYFVWNSGVFSCETDEYLKNYCYVKNLFNCSVITCDNIIDTSSTVSCDSIKKKKNEIQTGLSCFYYFLLVYGYYLLVYAYYC